MWHSDYHKKIPADSSWEAVILCYFWYWFNLIENTLASTSWKWQRPIWIIYWIINRCTSTSAMSLPESEWPNLSVKKLHPILCLVLSLLGFQVDLLQSFDCFGHSAFSSNWHFPKSPPTMHCCINGLCQPSCFCTGHVQLRAESRSTSRNGNFSNNRCLISFHVTNYVKWFAPAYRK